MTSCSTSARGAGHRTRVPIPPTTGGVNELTADGPDDIWATADQRQLVHWNGRRWRIVATPNLTDVTLIGLCVVSPTDAWAVGSAFQRDGSSALIEHWNGHTWHRVNSPTVGRSTQLTAVAAASPTDVWAFGSYISDNPTGIHTRSGIVHRTLGRHTLASRSPGGLPRHQASLHDLRGRDAVLDPRLGGRR
jgi:hypothetical protein